MSISYSNTPTALRVEIRPSNYFRVALIGVASAALGANFYAELMWPLRGLLVIAALIYSGYCWRTQARQRGILQWRTTWLWSGADGVERALRLRHSTVWPSVIVMNFRDAESKQKFVLTLFRDSLDADCARRLRVYLNHFPVFESAETLE